MKRILLASANPYTFCIAVEHHLAKRLGEGAVVDGFNMFRAVSLHSPFYQGAHGLAAKMARKYERFVRPHLSGRDITPEVVPETNSFPPLPSTEAELRRYAVGGAKVGLGALSTTVSVTTVRLASDLAEYGPTLEHAWRSAHISQRAGAIVGQMGYDEIYIFNGRQCYTRPFIDMVQPASRVLRYEMGATLGSFILSDESIHDASSFVKMIAEHPYDREAGERYYRERLAMTPGNEATRLRAHQVPGHLPDGVSPDGFVAYFSSSDDEMYAVRDDHSFGDFGSQMDIVRALAEICGRHGKQLVVRMHPHLRFKHESWRREWDFDVLDQAGVLVIGPADPCDTYALAGAAHGVVTRGSTVGFECTYLGIPNAVVGDSPGGRMGASVQADDVDALDRFVASPTLPPGARDRALEYGSFYTVGGEPMPEFDLRSHLSCARIDNRLVDPMRCFAQPARDMLAKLSNAKQH